MAATPDSKPAPSVTSPVQYLSGCGPDRAARLAKLGVGSIRELLFFLPRDYQDLTDLRSIDQLEEGPPVSVLGVVADVELSEAREGRSILGVLVQAGGDYLRAVWFNQPFMRERFVPGQRILLSGRAKKRFPRWEMAHPQVRWLDGEAEAPAGQLLPVYPLTAGLHQRHVRQLVRTALDRHLAELDEVFPERFLQEHNLLPLAQALPQVHFPASRAALEQARRRLVYQELFVLQVALAMRRAQTLADASAIPLEATARIDARIRRLIPFELTAGQNQAIVEICGDLARAQPMNRLLQGEVGSGKTVVAAYALLLAVAHGAQAALMAPTEILARQHVETLRRLLKDSQVRIDLISGSLTAAERQRAAADLAAGQTQIAVGTQALLGAGIEFARLALVVIDEQHKFGVRQRAQLRQSAEQPHYLVMTATPIPRSLAMTLFGDLDVTTLRDQPAGRQVVNTYLPPPADWPKWWSFLRRKLGEGRQAYVIVPLVDESQHVAAASLEEAYETLANGELEEFRLGLIHGRMSAAEKDAAMDAFRSGRTQVLVATPIVEVGVDVPNATLMTIQGAERFGLAQLHQLRGRVSRGVYPGYCCLMTDPTTDEANQRLVAFVQSQDGFRLAELDLTLRGPGDLAGTSQHGLPAFRIADLVRDVELLAEARRDAQALVAADPALADPRYARLRRMALVRYGAWLELADVG